MKMTNLNKLLFFFLLSLLTGCSVLGRNRYYAVIPHAESTGEARQGTFSVDTGIQGTGEIFALDDLVFGISAANSSVKSYSLGPWLLPVIPFPTVESNIDENIQLNIEVQSKKGTVALDLRKLTLILVDNKKFYPVEFYYRNDYPPQKFNGVWQINDRNIKDASAIFAVSKKGVKNFDVDISTIFSDKQQRNLPIFHFEEKTKNFIECAP